MLFYRDSNPGADPNNLNCHYDTLVLDKSPKPPSVKTEIKSKKETISLEIESKCTTIQNLENEPPKFEPCEEVNKPFAHSSIESASSIKSDISFSLDKSSNLDIILDDLGCSDGDMHDFCTGDTKKNNWDMPDVWIEDYSTTDSSMPAPPKQYNISKYNAKDSREKFKLDYFLFKKDERVPYIPHDINGMHKYIIHCTELEWKSKQKDGRYWKTTCGKNQNLNGSTEYLNAMALCSAQMRNIPKCNVIWGRINHHLKDLQVNILAKFVVI